MLDALAHGVYCLFMLRARLSLEDSLVQTGIVRVGIDPAAPNFLQELTKLEYHQRLKSAVVSGTRVRAVRPARRQSAQPRAMRMMHCPSPPEPCSRP